MAARKEKAISKAISKDTKESLAKIFREGKVVCLTGAGISAESGIPTFRGKDGLWEKYDPQVYATAEGLTYALRQNPGTLANFMRDFYTILLKARPNPAHYALAVLEKEGVLGSLITQNIDNLHQQAGNRKILELHGNAFRIRCSRCRRTITFEKDRIEEMLKLLYKNQGSGLGLMRVLSRYFPHCRCGLRYRPDIVLFGELLPEDALALAKKSLDECNTLVVVGTSLEVYPAAGLPRYAQDKGVRIVEINDEETPLSKGCALKINSKASAIFSELMQVLGYA